MDKPHRRPSKFSKTSTPSPVLSAHVRLAAEYWLDVFTERLMETVYNDDSHFTSLRAKLEAIDIDSAVKHSHSFADAALEAYERRWPGVKLP